MMHKLRGNVTKQSSPPLLPVYDLLDCTTVFGTSHLV